MRTGLLKKYGEEDKRGRPSVEQTLKDPEGNEIPNPKFALFEKDFLELLAQEVEIDIQEKVKLPEVVAATCDKCHHNMDKVLEIKPRVLIGLDKFVEIA